jgi:hypothetical protein
MWKVLVLGAQAVVSSPPPITVYASSAIRRFALSSGGRSLLRTSGKIRLCEVFSAARSSPRVRRAIKSLKSFITASTFFHRTRAGELASPPEAARDSSEQVASFGQGYEEDNSTATPFLVFTNPQFQSFILTGWNQGN